MSNISSIDDLLAASMNPKVTEPTESANPPTEDAENVEVEYESDPLPDADNDEPGDNDSDDGSPTDKVDEKTAPEDEGDEDEYGNKKERLPKGLKDRLDRKEKKHQEEMAKRDAEIYQLHQRLSQSGASEQVQNAVKDFKHDPDSEVAWEQQLAEFVEKTVSNMASKKQTQQRAAQEQQAERQLSEKITSGLQRFPDFKEVVGALPMSDAMTNALRGIADPAAFIYAAGIQQAAEIDRISKLSDPYAQMVEMGKLEERMRKNKPSTKAPRPIGKMKEDTTARVTPKAKEATGDDLLAKADAKRLFTTKNRHHANR